MNQLERDAIEATITDLHRAKTTLSVYVESPDGEGLVQLRAEGTPLDGYEIPAPGYCWGWTQCAAEFRERLRFIMKADSDRLREYITELKRVNGNDESAR